MSRNSDLDLFALMRGCRNPKFRETFERIPAKNLKHSAENFSNFITDFLLRDIDGMAPLPDPWVRFCKERGYSLHEEIARSSIGWICAVQSLCSSWQMHRSGGCSLCQSTKLLGDAKDKTKKFSNETLQLFRALLDVANERPLYLTLMSGTRPPETDWHQTFKMIYQQTHSKRFSQFSDSKAPAPRPSFGPHVSGPSSGDSRAPASGSSFGAQAPRLSFGSHVSGPSSGDSKAPAVASSTDDRYRPDSLVNYWASTLWDQSTGQNFSQPSDPLNEYSPDSQATVPSPSKIEEEEEDVFIVPPPEPRPPKDKNGIAPDSSKNSSSGKKTSNGKKRSGEPLPAPKSVPSKKGRPTEEALPPEPVHPPSARSSSYIDILHSESIYDPLNDDIIKEQVQCQELLYDFNHTRPTELPRRTELLRKMFAEIGEDCYVEPPLHANWGGHFVHFGKNVYANYNLTLVDDTHIYVGDRCMFGPNVTIATAGHPILPELREKGLQYNIPVRIGRNCWIGAGAMIMPGVTIGDNTVIGAGSVVTRDIPANVVAVGNPCHVLRPIGERDRQFFFRDRRIPTILLQ